MSAGQTEETGGDPLDGWANLCISSANNAMPPTPSLATVADTEPSKANNPRLHRHLSSSGSALRMRRVADWWAGRCSDRLAFI